MAVIFEPHGPLSLPWENTTVLNETLIPPHFVALRDQET
jgi:hypothetical protein